MICIDFEGYSALDLKTVGAHVYAAHPSTRILCMAWAIGDMAPQCVRPGQRFPDVLARAWRDGVDTTWAWNAAFESVMVHYRWARDFPNVPRPTRWACSMALAASCGLPLSLAACAAFLAPEDTSLHKDARGIELIQLCCKPGKDGTQPVLSPALRSELEAYCVQDVVAERGVHRALPVAALSQAERAVWAVDQTINQRGFLVDTAFIAGANRLRAGERARNGRLLAAVTANAVDAPTKVAKLVAWVRAHNAPLQSGSAEHVTDALLNRPSPAVARVLRLRQVGSLTSLGKFARFLVCLGRDRRVRGCFQYNGAQVTGRWSGRLAQPQNLPRPTRDCSHLIDAIRAGDAELIRLMAGDVSLVLKDCLRHVIIAKPGHTLAVVDVNAIEARVSGWLSNEPGYLEAFRLKRDLYKQTASSIYSRPESDIAKPSHERDVGKAAALSLQYGSGPDSFFAKCKKDGIPIPLPLCQRIVRVYRERYPAIPAAWRKLEALAIAAVARPGTVCTFRNLLHFSCERGFLRMRLPSGRTIFYARPEVKAVDRGYGPRPSLVVMQDTKGAMRRVRMWGGVFYNNCWTAETLVVTSAGLKPIVSITPYDLVWDGMEWVSQKGLTCHPNQRVGRWCGVRVTPQHLIHDGGKWCSVMDMDASATARSLSHARASTASPSLDRNQESTVACMAAVIAANFVASLSASCGVEHALSCAAPAQGSKEAGADVVKMILSLKILMCSGSGAAVTQLSSHGARFPERKHIAITEREAFEYIESGLLAGTLFSDMLNVLTAMPIPVLNWIDGIMIKDTYQAISAWCRALSIQITGEVIYTLPIAASDTQLHNSGVPGAIHGQKGLSTDTLTSAIPESELWQPTGDIAPVYDLVDCGPRHRYMVITKLGPVIVHNCVQGISRDILAEALVAIEPFAPVVLHAHDEIGSEIPEPGAADVLARMVAIMSATPAWAAGLPLAAEGFLSKHYKK